MPNTANVSAGKPKVAGAVYRAPKGTTLPTDATTALASAFVDMGYISEDGVVNSNSPSSEKIKDWGGQTVLIVKSDKPDTFKIKFIEALNSAVLQTVYGSANVTTGTNTITVVANAKDTGEYVYAIDMVMTGGALKRIVIPCGVLSALADITYKNNEAIGYEVTLDALPDSSGNNHYEYMSTASSSSST